MNKEQARQRYAKEEARTDTWLHKLADQPYSAAVVGLVLVFAAIGLINVVLFFAG